MKYITHLKWTIKDFDEVASPTGSNAALISQDFGILGTTSFAYLSFCHTNPFSGPNCSLYLHVKVADKKAAGKTIVNLSIKNTRGRKIGKQDALECENLLGGINFIGFEEAVLRSDIYPPSAIIKDRTLVIECRIGYTVGDDLTERSLPEPSCSEKILQGCIVIHGQDQFCVAKHLLVSSSAHFKNLLESDSNEARTGIIILENMDHDIFLEFQHFIYFARSSGTWPLESIQGLYELAEHYSFDRLKGECKQRLLRTVEENELLICLKMGFVQNDRELKKHALDELRKRFSSRTGFAYFESLEWIQFAEKNLSLAMEIKVSAYKAVGILARNYNLR